MPLWLNEKEEWAHHLGLRDLTHAVVCKDKLIKLDIDKVSNEDKNKFIKENHYGKIFYTIKIGLMS